MLVVVASLSQFNYKFKPFVCKIVNYAATIYSFDGKLYSFIINYRSNYLNEIVFASSKLLPFLRNILCKTEGQTSSVSQIYIKYCVELLLLSAAELFSTNT